MTNAQIFNELRLDSQSKADSSPAEATLLSLKYLIAFLRKACILSSFVLCWKVTSGTKILAGEDSDIYFRLELQNFGMNCTSQLKESLNNSVHKFLSANQRT